MKQVRYLQQLSANTHYFLKAIAIVFLLMLFVPQCMKREIFFQQEKPILISGTIRVEDAIHFLNEKYPQYNTDSIQWQYAYIREFDDGNSLLKVVWKEDYESPIFTDIIVWTNNDTMNGVLFEVYPDTNYLWEKKILLGEGHNTRYYVYDDDFTGVMAMGDLKTHEFIEGRVYENGKIVSYIYPNPPSSIVKAGYDMILKVMQINGGGSISGMLSNVTVYSSYGKGNGGSLGFPATSFGGGISGGGYSSGGGGSGGLSGNKNNTNSQNQAPQKTPCDHIKTLTQAKPFQEMMKGLKEKLKEEVEYGYTYRQKGGEYETKLFKGIPGAEVDMTASKNNPIDGFVHTHYEINGMNATGYIFSMHDMWLMVKAYTTGSMVDAGSFSIGVMTPQNTYILKIENLLAFQAFAEKYRNEDDLMDKADKGKYYWGSRYEENYETEVLKFLNDLNTGMVLYKTKTNDPNQNFDKWTSPRLSSDKQTIYNNDCK